MTTKLSLASVLGRLALVLAVGGLGALMVTSASRPAAAAAAACSLPGQITCSTDPECTAYGAVCDPTALVCVCAPASTDAGATTTTGTTTGSTTSTTGASTSSGNGGPPATGGASPPPAMQAGCSFAPGQRI